MDRKDRASGPDEGVSTAILGSGGLLIGKARAMGAITVVNAIASGKGAAVSVHLPTHAKVEVDVGEGSWRVSVNGKRAASPLAVRSVLEAIAVLGKEPTRYSGSIETTTSVPAGVGLKTSSSSSVAIILATLSAFGEDAPEQSEVLRCSARASIATGVSVTGAIDDAAACMLGGANFTDNSAMNVESSAPIGLKLPVVIKLPPGRSRRGTVGAGKVKRFSEQANHIFNVGRQGRVWKAMTLNGLLYSSIYGYSPSDAISAIEAGALGAGLSGTGPSIAAVFDNRDQAEQLARAWEGGRGRVFRTETSDGGATIGA